MKASRAKTSGCIFVFLAFLVTTIIFILNQVSDFGKFNFSSRDISLSNSHLCITNGEDCLPLENNVFFENEFSNVKVCTEYSSSEPATLTIYLFPLNDYPAFGMLDDQIGEAGSLEICYSLTDVVDSLENSNIGGKSKSPVSDGVIEPGKYEIVFKQGRVQLEELDFQVLSAE